MVYRHLATAPGRWWMDLSGIMATLLGEVFSTLTSVTQTEQGHPKRLLSITGVLSVTMVFPVMKPPERSKAISPVTFTGGLVILLYR